MPAQVSLEKNYDERYEAWYGIIDPMPAIQWLKDHDFMTDVWCTMWQPIDAPLTTEEQTRVNNVSAEKWQPEFESQVPQESFHLLLMDLFVMSGLARNVKESANNLLLKSWRGIWKNGMWYYPGWRSSRKRNSSAACQPWACHRSVSSTSGHQVPPDGLCVSGAHCKRRQQVNFCSATFKSRPF